MSNGGSHLQTLGRTIPSHVNLDIAELEHGGFRVTPMRSGNILVRVRYYGFMEDVSDFVPIFLPEADDDSLRSGRRKDCHLVRY